MRKSIYKIFLLGAVGMLMVSCKMRQDYQRPKDIAEEKLFRTDLLPKDSTSIAGLSWKEIFTDPILQKHISKALENNLDIRIALQNIASAEAYLKQSKAAYAPTLSVGPDYSYGSVSLNSQSGQSLTERKYVNQFDLTATLGWEADLWGKLKSQKRAQVASYLGSVAAHQTVKSGLVASVATAYFQLLSFDEQKKILQHTIEVRQKNLEITKALKVAGILSEVAVQQSAALVYNAEASLISIDNQIQVLENTMSLLLGEAPHEIERSNLGAQNFNMKTEVGYPVSLLANRPEVRQAEYSLINAYELTNSANAQFYPSLKLTANAGMQALDVDQLFSANSLFSNMIAGLTQPILNKRQIRTNYEVSLANKEKAYLVFRKSILVAGKEVSDALKIYSSQDQFILLKKKELKAYDQSMEYSQELVNNGMANYLEVLNANVNKLNAELNIANAQYVKLQSGVELYRALGGGWK